MTEHLPIQRWTKIFTRYPASEVLPNENGEYVTYADHLAALRACEQRVQKIAYAPGLGAGSDEHGQHEIGWIKGYTAALSEVDEKVLRLQTHYSTLDGDTTVNRAEVLWITYCMRGEDQ